MEDSSVSTLTASSLTGSICKWKMSIHILTSSHHIHLTIHLSIKTTHDCHLILYILHSSHIHFHIRLP